MNGTYVLFLLAGLGLVWTAAPAHAGEPDDSSRYSVRSFGALGDGQAKDTAAVQKAVDACAGAGGGTVHFPSGTYLCGSLHLRSHVTLHLDNGATLLASTDDADFDPYEELGFENDSDAETSYFHFSLLWGEDIENVAIVGSGAIDSNRKDRHGPKTIGLKRCKFVIIRDITIRNAGNYAISMLGTDFVNVDGVSILSSYCDGIDPDCCHNVRISNCFIESWDDAIVPKASFSLGCRRSTENITVTNCVLATACNAFKLGTESAGDFKHITVSNCVMTTFKSKVDYREPTPSISGVSLISVDGSHLENVVVNNLTMDGVRYPIFMRLGNRGRDTDDPVPGTLKDVIISNVTASDALIAGIVIGQPERPIENVLLDNVRIACKGGGSKEQPGPDVPAMMLKYPSGSKFADLPTYGLYGRHVEGLTLEDVHLTCESPDTRHALIFEDVADLTVDSLSAPAPQGAAARILFDQVRGATIRGCRPPAGTEVFLHVLGEGSTGIGLLSNDFGNVSEVVTFGQGAEEGDVSAESNL